jgi:long-chain fatty acid transport protein
MTKSFTCLLVGALVAASFMPRSLSAAGFAIHEQSGQAMGTAGAYVAGQSAGSIFYNPAGIADLEGRQMEFGLNLIMPTTDFTGPTNLPDYGTLSMEEQIFTPVDIYFVQDLGERLKLGFGMFTYMGLGTEWAEDWVGRTITEEISLETITMNPVIAWKAGSSTSLAFGLTATFGMATMSKDSYVGYPFNGYLDVDLEGEGWGFGWNFGLQHQVTKELRLGLSYRSGMVLAAEGDAEFTQQSIENPTHQALLGALFPKTDVNLDLDIPEMMIMGFSYNPQNFFDGKLTWRADAVYTGWEAYRSLYIDFVTETEALEDSNSPKLYDDTWAFRTGVEYAMNDQWTLRGGWYYEQNAVRDHMVEPSLPDAERNGVSVGCSYEISEDWGVDAYFIQVMLGDRTSTFEEFPGGYESQIPIVGFSLRKSL